MSNAFNFINETLRDAFRIFTSKDSLRALHGVSLYRNAIYLMVNSAVLLVTGFFFWVVATRLYPEESVGIASAAISAIGLLTLLSTLGLDFGLIRFLASAEDKSNDMIDSCFTIGGLTSLIVAIIYLVGINIWSPDLIEMRTNVGFFIAFVITCVLYTFQGFCNQTFIAKRRAGLFLAQSVIFGLIRFLPLILLTSTFQFFGIFISLSISVCIAVIIGVIIFLPRVHNGYRPSITINRSIIIKMIRFSFANYITNIFWLLPQFILPLMVISLLGAEQNAFFYIGWSVGSILYVIPTATSFSLFAEGSYDENLLGREIRRSLKLIFVLLVPAILLVILLADKILLVFGGSYSENATDLLRLLALNTLPMSINYIYIAVRRVQKNMRGVVVLAIILVFLTLILSYFLLPRWGIMGAGVACLISQGIMSITVILIFINRNGQDILTNR